jgi:hypothetical protein
VLAAAAAAIWFAYFPPAWGAAIIGPVGVGYALAALRAPAEPPFGLPGGVLGALRKLPAELAAPVTRAVDRGLRAWVDLRDTCAEADALARAEVEPVLAEATLALEGMLGRAAHVSRLIGRQGRADRDRVAADRATERLIADAEVIHEAAGTVLRYLAAAGEEAGVLADQSRRLHGLSAAYEELRSLPER